MTKIKICGLTNLDDSMECIRLGVDYLGFIFAQSPRRADPKIVSDIRRSIGPSVTMVGVFTEESDEVLQIVDECSLDLVQLHGGQSEQFAKRIGSDRVIRVIKVSDSDSLNEINYYTTAKHYLLDTYSKSLQGGTGSAWEWTMLSQMHVFDKDIILAGGLNPDNIYEAILTTHPFAVDVSSGVESSPGKKDFVKLERLVRNVNECN